MRTLHTSTILTLEAGDGSDRFGVTREFLRLRMPDWVAVVVVDAHARWVLVEQHRFGTDARALEVVGGVIEPGETPEEAAVREVLEETGLGAGQVRSLGVLRPNPALQDNRCFLFEVIGAAPLADPAPDPTERLTLRFVDRARVGQWLASGEIDAALSVVALERALRRE